MKHIILAENPKEEYTLIARVKDDEVFEYVVAWKLLSDGTWCQGHYFGTDLKAAVEYLYEIII